MAAQQPQQLNALLRQAGRLGRQALLGLCSSSASVARSPGCTGASGGVLAQNCLRHLASSAEAAAASTSGRAASSSGLKGLLQNYKQLSKFKLSSLVVLTASAGFVAASGEEIDYAKLGWTSLGTFGAAACANTLNQIYEVANDARMSRTRNRPLPTGRMTKLHAAAFAVTMGAAGLYILYEKANPLTMALGAANIVLYAGIYTPLKQITIANTWVGAVVGAIPPLMGWAAASGQLDAGSMALAATLFFWQMPHFLALAWMCKADYIAGGFRMLSMLDPTGRRTAFAALRHCLYIAPVGLLAHLSGFTSQAFAWEAAALSAYLAYACATFMRTPSQATARKLFKSSLLYLPLLLAAMTLHRTPNDHSVDWATLQRRVVGTLPPDVRRAAEGAAEAVLGTLGYAGSRVGGVLVANNVKCPSIAYGDSEELHKGAGQGQGRQEDGQAAGQVEQGEGQALQSQQQQQPGESVKR